MEALTQFISTIDPNLLKVIGIVIIVVGVFTIIKKAMKLAAVILVIGIVATSLGLGAGNWQEKFNFSMDGGVLNLHIMGNDFSIDTKSIADVVVGPEENSLTGYTIKMANGEEVTFELPSMAAGLVNRLIKTHN